MTTNEAAERLRHTIGQKIGLAGPLWEPDLDAALATERRATVERIGLSELLSWLEQLDKQADDTRRSPTVEVSAMLWKDMIRPLLQRARVILDEEAAR